MDTAQDLFNPAPTPQEFQSPTGDKFFVGPDGSRAMLGSEDGTQVEFFEDARKLELASKEAGIPIFKKQTLVKVRCKYDPKSVHVYLVQEGEEDEYKVRFAREWQQYLRSKEAAAVGTPVMTWMELAPTEKATLDAIGIITLEQLVAADDVLLAKVFTNVKKIKESAMAQLNYKNRIVEITDVTKKLVASNAQNEAKDEVIAMLRAEKEAMQEAMRNLKSKATKTSLTGRPAIVRPLATKLQEEVIENLPLEGEEPKE